jgi:hypothetical protein
MLCLRIFACTCLASAAGLAGPIGLASLERLVQEATMIVVAEVAQRAQSGRSASVMLEVQRTLKGPGRARVLTAGIEVSSEFAMRRNLKGLQGIWFLSARNGTLSVLPAILGSVPLEFLILPALPDLPLSWTPSAPATPMEKVLCELAAALEINGDAGPGLSANFLSQTPAGPATSLRRLYRRMLESSSAPVSSAGLSGLIRSGDVEGLVSLESKLTQIMYGPSMAQPVCAYFNGNIRGLALLAALSGQP